MLSRQKEILLPDYTLPAGSSWVMHRQPLMNGQINPSIRPALCDYITPHPSLTAHSNLLPFFLSDNIQTRLPTRLLT